jgi:hypothetical protein
MSRAYEKTIRVNMGIRGNFYSFALDPTSKVQLVQAHQWGPMIPVVTLEMDNGAPVEEQFRAVVAILLTPLDTCFDFEIRHKTDNKRIYRLERSTEEFNNEP